MCTHTAHTYMKGLDIHSLLFTVDQKAGGGGKTSTKIIAIVPTLLSKCFLCALNTLTTQRGRNYYYPHYTEEGIEAKRT